MAKENRIRENVSEERMIEYLRDREGYTLDLLEATYFPKPVPRGVIEYWYRFLKFDEI